MATKLLLGGSSFPFLLNGLPWEQSLPNVPIWSFFVQTLITDRPAGQSKAGCGNQIPGAFSWPPMRKYWAPMTTSGQILYSSSVSWKQMPILVKPPLPPMTGKEKWLWSAGKSAGLWNTAADPLKVFLEPAAVDPLLLLDLLLYFAWSSPPPAKDLLCFILSSWRESIAWGVSGVFGRQAFYWCDDGEGDKWEIRRQIEKSWGWFLQIQIGPAF